MNTKLTLKLNKRASERAKRYTKKHKQSLSVLVENYFNVISEKENSNEIEITPNVLELSGILKVHKDVDIREMYGKHLEEKYSI